MKICSHRNYVVTASSSAMGTVYDLWCKDCGSISKLTARKSGIWARTWRKPAVSKK